ncbi:MAG: hypothetical protein Q6373_020540 [Candidatus Sigynarchaeota archaeon]
MASNPISRDPKGLWLVARACKAIVVDGMQPDLVIARVREERGFKGGIEWLAGDVAAIIRHHGFLNFIAISAGAGIKNIPRKDDERHFFHLAILFHVFKDRIENETFRKFTDVERDSVANMLERMKPRLEPETMALVHNAIRLNIPALLRNKESVERLSILFSHPSTFVERLVRLLPKARVERILQAQQRPGPFFILARNPEALDRVINFLVGSGITFQSDKTFSNVLQVSNFVGAKGRVVESGILDMRNVIIQDWASIAVLEALNIVKGDVVIDACAAPFQKTTGIWWRCGRSGKVVAMEANPVRASINARRLPIEARKAIHVVLSDATRFGTNLRGIVPDKILLDVPCTGSGSLATFPELKARQSAKDIAFFSSLQMKILGAVLETCKANGWHGVHVVYSSCSYYPEEGEEIIDNVIDRIDLVDLHNPGALTARLAALPTGWKGYKCSLRVARTFPDTNGGSKAFFIAAFTTRA